MRNAVIRKKAIAMRDFLTNPTHLILGAPAVEMDWDSYCHQQFFSVPENRAAL
jgi:hypothetical protein